MYAAQPDLSAVDQVQLVQLIVLADRYEVPKAAKAAAAAIRKLPIDQLQWETVFTVYSMPCMGCAGVEACTDVFAAAAAKMHLELGDLEVAWADAEKQERLQQLPFPLLKQLLSSSSTRVASDDTVLYTLERWCAWQQQHMPPGLQPTDAQLRELVGCVRMSHCSKAYATTIFDAGAVAVRALQPTELAQTGMVAGTGIAARNAAVHGNLSKSCPWVSPVLRTFPAWASYRRPLTQRRQSDRFTFTAEQVEGLFREAEAGAAAAVAAGVDSHRAILYSNDNICFQGVPAAVGVAFLAEMVDPGASFSYGFAVRLVGLPAEAVLPCSYKMLSTSPGIRGQAVKVQSADRCGAYTSGFHWAGVTDWGAFKAHLISIGWLQPDGSMAICCKQSFDEGNPEDFDPALS